jgi:hypothetical protein
LMDNLCAFGRNTFREAASNGNLENMKWLNAHQCPWGGPWGSATFGAAASRGII